MPGVACEAATDGWRSCRSGVRRSPWSALERLGAGAGEPAADSVHSTERWRSQRARGTSTATDMVTAAVLVVRHVANVPVLDFPVTAGKNLGRSFEAGRQLQRSRKLSRRPFLFSDVCVRNACRCPGSSTYPSQGLAACAKLPPNRSATMGNAHHTSEARNGRIRIAANRLDTKPNPVHFRNVSVGRPCNCPALMHRRGRNAV